MKDKHIDPLEALDHTQIEYQAFEKSFYTEHPDIVGLSPIQIIDLQQKLGIRYVSNIIIILKMICNSNVVSINAIIFFDKVFLSNN